MKIEELTNWNVQKWSVSQQVGDAYGSAIASDTKIMNQREIYLQRRAAFREQIFLWIQRSSLFKL